MESLCGFVVGHVVMIMMCRLVWLFLFCKQNTAYEMRISDWSSDVCSSDLQRQRYSRGQSARSFRTGRNIARSSHDRLQRRQGRGDRAAADRRPARHRVDRPAVEQRREHHRLRGEAGAVADAARGTITLSLRLPPAPHIPKPRAMAPRIDHIENWIFDLDNTLYPPSAKLFDLIDDRMGAFIMRLLDVDAVEARRVQKQYFQDRKSTRLNSSH